MWVVLEPGWEQKIVLSEAVASSVGDCPGVCLASSRFVCKELMLPRPWNEGTLSLTGFMGC